MDKIKKFFKALFTILKDNVKRPNFWVSLITLGLVAALVVLKLVFKVDIANASILGVVTSVGIVISLIGQMLGNSSVVSAGESLDATKITSAADKLADTLQSISDQVKAISDNASTTKDKVAEVAKAVGVEDSTTGDTQDESKETITSSLGTIVDTDGNIVGTAPVQTTTESAQVVTPPANDVASNSAATVVTPSSVETVKKAL